MIYISPPHPNLAPQIAKQRSIFGQTFLKSFMIHVHSHAYKSFSGAFSLETI
jgi:hypothetical protein